MVGNKSAGGTAYLAYVNGRYVAPEFASVSVFDRGLLYGDGAFESIRLCNGYIFRLDKHLARLRTSLGYLGIPADLDSGEPIVEVIRRNRLLDGYIRVVVTRGIGSPGINPQKTLSGPTIIVTVTSRPPLCLEVDALSAHVVDVRQASPTSIDPRQKTLNYANKVIAKNQATAVGADVPILLNDEGIVTEGGTENIFIVKEKKVVTSPVDTGLLPGVTRASVLEICERSGITCAEVPIHPRELLEADEVFITSTSSGVVPIAQVGDTTYPLPPDGIVPWLRGEYLNIIAGRDSKFLDWLTPVPLPTA